jgi:hypothetical protein
MEAAWPVFDTRWMDELSRRVLAQEMALVEIAAHMNPIYIRAAMLAIEAGLVDGQTKEDRAIRLQALQYLKDALQRDNLPSPCWPTPTL